MSTCIQRRVLVKYSHGLVGAAPPVGHLQLQLGGALGEARQVLHGVERRVGVRLAACQRRRDVTGDAVHVNAVYADAAVPGQSHVAIVPVGSGCEEVQRSV